MSSEKYLEKEWKNIKEVIDEQFHTKRKILRDLDLFVLDNSIRETTVGQLRGHTLKNKIAIYEEAKKCGFEYFVVAAFNHFTRVGDTFCQWLVDNNEDRNKLFSFSEVTESIKNGKMDSETIPVSLLKCKKFGIPNVILEMDLADSNVNWTKFTTDDMCALLKKRLNWCYKNLSEKSKVLFNFRDFAFAMVTEKGAKRLLKIVKFLGSLPNRGFGLCMEEFGKVLPEEVGAWCASVRRVMNSVGWNNGKLLAHFHKRWGLAHTSQLECLMNGADGIWAGVCEEGASVGHASSTVTIMNLIRMGNKKLLRKYNCQYLRQAAIKVTELTTGKPPHFRELIYGERALDIWLPGDPSSVKEFDLAKFFSVEAPKRITDVSSAEMIKQKLIDEFGIDPQFTLSIAKQMKERLLDDMKSGRKEEYMSKVGIAVLFDRAGGKITEKMRDVIEHSKVKSPHMKELIDEVKKIWDEWDLCDEVANDDRLQFDSFYNGFMAPYFGCFRCEDAQKGLQAIDMDNDGYVDWSEFLVYLKWAARQYPEVTTAEQLVATAFTKGLIPAMQDETLKAVGWNLLKKRQANEKSNLIKNLMCCSEATVTTAR